MRPLFLAALALRIGVALALFLHAGSADAFPAQSDDGDAYDAAARFVVWGTPIDHARFGAKWLEVAPDPAARWPSAYWLLLAGAYRVFGVDLGVPVLLAFQAVLGAAAATAVARLAQHVRGSSLALLAGALVAGSSTLVLTSAALYAEALYVPLLVFGLMCAAEAHLATSARRWAAWAFAGGVCFGLAEATRPLAMPVFVVTMAWLLTVGGSRGVSTYGRGRTLGVAATMIASAMVALGPFVVRDLATLGRVALFSAGGAEALYDRGLGEQLVALGVDPYRAGLLGALGAAAAQPGAVLAALAGALPERLLVLFVTGGWGPLAEPIVQWLGPWAIVPRLLTWAVALHGLITMCRKPASRPAAALLLCAVLALLVPTLVLGLPLVRYRVPADPILVVWVAAGILALGSRLGLSRSRRARGILPALL